MEAERDEAIVLRRQPVTESSLVVTWYSRDHGKLKTMAKGARRIKGPFLGRLDLFFQDEILFLRSRRSDLHTLTECDVLQHRLGLRSHLDALGCASYAGELVELSAAVEDPNPVVFDLLSFTLDELERQSSAVILIWFELCLFKALGWKPKWSGTSPAARMLESLAGATLDGARRIRLTGEQIRDTRTKLWRFTDEHLAGIPRARRFLPCR